MCCACVLQAGKIGIALNIEYLEPWTESAVDKAAATTGLEAALGWFADPLFFGEQAACSPCQHNSTQHHTATCCTM